MKLTLILLTAVFFQAVGATYGQRVTLKVKNEKLIQVIEKIQLQTKYDFLYNTKDIRLAKLVSIDIADAPLQQTLDKCFDNQALTYTIQNTSILIYRKPLPQRANIARLTIKGSVTDEKGEPLAGASVMEKGTNNGTTVKKNGSFEIDVVDVKSTLVFSFLGYKAKEVMVGNETNIVVSLQPVNSSLNEVVVTGYTAQRKKDITGAVAIVDVASMKTVVSGNTTTLLQGQASGVTVTNSGQPGAATSINIRGIGSIFSTAPLVIIDGVQGSLDNINANDIESIQVLKDAGSASIYGVRGANGVIVVTTKKGKAGNTVVSYDATYGTTRPVPNGLKLGNTQTYMEAEFESYKNDGLVGAGHPNVQFDPKATGIYTIPDYITPAGAHFGDPNTSFSSYNLNTLTGVGTNPITLANKTGTDWFHSVFRAAPIQQHNLSVSGGNDKSVFLLSLGYLNQQGTLLSTYDKRYSIRANSSYNIAKHVRIGENLYWYYKQNPQITNQNDGNTISYIYREPPIIPYYDIAGNFAGTRSNGLGNSNNPLSGATRALSNTNNNWNFSGNVFAEIDFLKHFTYRTSFGGALDNVYYSYFSPTAYENAESNTATNGFTEGSAYYNNYTWGNYLTYKIQLKEHSIKVLAGTEAITSTGRSLSAIRGNYTISTDPNYVSLSTGDPSTQNNTDTRYSNTLLSYFGRLEYAFQDKYLLSGNIRRDGSSFFAPGHQWGIFPSGSAGWRISKENFLKDVSWINELKIRIGYGTLGSLGGVSSQPYNAYNLYSSNVAKSYYDIKQTSTSSVLGIYKSQNGNVNTTWETDKEANIGFDAVLLNNSIDMSFDYFRKSVSGLLFQEGLLASQADAAAPFVNSGDLRNTGWDFNITYHNQATDFRYSAGLNLSHYTNLVQSLAPGVPYEDVNSSGSNRIGNFVRLKPGEPVGEFFGYQEIGLYQNAADVANSAGYAGAAPGFMKFKDINGDGKIDANDRTFIGNPNPKLTGGLNLSASYQNFDLNIFLYGVYGNKIANFTKYFTDFPQVFDGNVSANILSNSWHAGADNSNATIPVLTRQANLGSSAAFSSYYIQNGSFLKLKSLQLGYTIPSTKIKQLGISRLKVFVLCNNLFTITRYDGLDPELQNSNLNNNTSFGIDFGSYPNNEKRYTMGIQAIF